MGQKVNPISLRLGINKTWKSRWFVDKREYADTLLEDLKIRKIIETCPETKGADIAEVEIIRQPQKVTIVINTSKPGVIIGAKGTNIEKLGLTVQKVVGRKIQIKIKEIKKPEINSTLVAKNIAKQLEGRVAFRRVMKQAVNNAMKVGVQGIKIKISGRLGGAEMSREQQYKEGRVPLHTFRADIDYGFAEAFTTFGAIGVKVWIFKGEVFKKDRKDDAGQLLKNKKEKSTARG